MKPKIFVFSNVQCGGEGVAYAMAEDGVVLGSHYCSDEEFARHDLGFIKRSRPDRHKKYAEHYPDWYKMEFVPSSEVLTHEGLKAALALNDKLRIEAENEAAKGQDD